MGRSLAPSPVPSSTLATDGDMTTSTSRKPPVTASSELRPITALRGVGDALAQKLEKLGIARVQDLLFLLPLRYEDRTRVAPIGSLQAGDRAVVEGEVQLTEVAFRGRRQLLCRISDGSGTLLLRFFYFSSSQQQALTRGARVRCYGEIRRGLNSFEIVHPEYRRVAAGAPNEVESALTPIYPLTEGVQQGRLRQLTAMALHEVANESIRDWLPPAVLKDLDLPSLREALEYVHRPPPDASLALALHRSASGAAPARVRRTARAPAEPAVVAQGDSARSGVAARTAAVAAANLHRVVAVPADRCAAARMERD